VFQAKWAFEKVFNHISLINSVTEAKQQFFKYPHCLKPFYVSSNLMTTLNVQRDKSAWLLFIATLILAGLFAFVNLSEFVTVGVLKQTSGYPFGGEGPTPWFYKSAQLYATVNLVFGLLFLLPLATGVWSFLRFKKKVLIICFGLSLFLILLQLLTGQSD
jgi:glycopeptide antibiotics resistance protein